MCPGLAMTESTPPLGREACARVLRRPLGDRVARPGVEAVHREAVSLEVGGRPDSPAVDLAARDIHEPPRPVARELLEQPMGAQDVGHQRLDRLLDVRAGVRVRGAVEHVVERRAGEPAGHGVVRDRLVRPLPEGEPPPEGRQPPRAEGDPHAQPALPGQVEQRVGHARAYQAVRPGDEDRRPSERAEARHVPQGAKSDSQSS